MDVIERHVEKHRPEALNELEYELMQFSHDGLVALREDLKLRNVVFGSWAGCPLSYRRGERGSANCDRRGNSKNAFTSFWDNGWLTEEDVLRAVDYELDQRPVPAPPAQVLRLGHGANA